MNSYKDLDIYKISLDLFYATHPASLLLPKHELYELGSQLVRSSDSIVTNIEGYGRRKYKADFIRFLAFSHSSCLETINYLYKNAIANNLELIQLNNDLGRKIYNFIKYVEQNHKS